MTALFPPPPPAAPPPAALPLSRAAWATVVPLQPAAPPRHRAVVLGLAIGLPVAALVVALVVVLTRGGSSTPAQQSSAIPAAAGAEQHRRGVQASMKSDLRTVANEMETYFTDNQTYRGAAAYLLYGDTSVGTDSLTLSAGNTVTVEKAGLNGFCLKATNPDVPQAWYYDSLNGGITLEGCLSSGY